MEIIPTIHKEAEAISALQRIGHPLHEYASENLLRALQVGFVQTPDVQFERLYLQQSIEDQRSTQDVLNFLMEQTVQVA